MRLVAPSAALLLVALGCAPPAADTSAAAKTAIDAANATWPRLTAAGHADSLADFYAANAVIMPPNMPAMRGREAIRTFFKGMNAGPPHAIITLHGDSVWGNGAAAVEIGRWTFSWPAGTKVPPGVPAGDSGKYLVRWVQENGKWLLAQDIWNSDLPPAMMPAAPAPTH